MPAVKICGICRLEDAILSYELGADLIGFVFAESPRQIEAAEARLICRNLRGKIPFVGVFKDADIRLVNDTASALKLDFVQLHGKESPQYCAALNSPVIKAIELHSDELQSGKMFQNPEDFLVHAFLFDRPKSEAKDSSFLSRLKNAPWAIEKLERHQPFFIAGGLNSLNIEDALALKPYGLDTASGVEASPGVKDKQKLADFIQAAKGKYHD